LNISIIMNIRDGADYLHDALDSVMAQTFMDWELIVWDDRSTDNSAAIVAEYQDARIRYFLSEEDTGLGRARHLAVDQAKGDWLAFLDQDDIWLPDKLAKQVALIGTNNDGKLGIVYGRTLAVYPNGSEWDFDSSHEFKRLPEGDIFVDLLTRSCFINMSSAMLLRSAFYEIGGIPDEFQLACDYYLFVAIARGYRAKAVDDIVCYYRIHEDSLSRVYREPMILETFVLLDQWAPLVDPLLLARSRRFHYALRVLAISVIQLRSFVASAAPCGMAAYHTCFLGRLLTPIAVFVAGCGRLPGWLLPGLGSGESSPPASPVWKPC